MRVLLRDLDNTGFGNLALMKLSAWHKRRGDQVFLSQAPAWDSSYVSCVFTINAKEEECPPGAEIGGTGFKANGWLPPEVEHIMPDYSVYGQDLGYSTGFTSRGCIRRCPWCVVHEKEGGIKPWAEIYEFWDRHHHDRIRLLDNNLLASPNWRETMEAVIRERLLVDFNQGLDIRLVTDEVASYLKRVGRCTKLRFSFDEWSNHEAVREGIRRLVEAGLYASQLHFYLLLGFTQDPDGDYARLDLLREFGCSIFPMVYIDGDGVVHPPARGPIPKDMHGDRNRMRKLARLKGVVTH